jgi:hypothetical protein
VRITIYIVVLFLLLRFTMLHVTITITAFDFAMQKNVKTQFPS